MNWILSFLEKAGEQGVADKEQQCNHDVELGGLGLLAKHQLSMVRFNK
jgi:hypothetical protein